MTDPSLRKISNLATVVLSMVGWVGVRAILSGCLAICDYPTSLVVDVPAWLSIGALMRNAILPNNRVISQGSIEFLETFLLGWILVGLLWFLPVWFPSLQTNVNGIGINSQKSPLVLLIIMAFLLGFFMQAFVKLFPFAWKQASTSLVAFFKGDSVNSLQYYWENVKKSCSHPYRRKEISLSAVL